MSLSASNSRILLDAARNFQHDDTFGFVQSTSVLERCFGQSLYPIGSQAAKWKTYFDDLNEFMETGGIEGPEPKMPDIEEYPNAPKSSAATPSPSIAPTSNYATSSAAATDDEDEMDIDSDDESAETLPFYKNEKSQDAVAYRKQVREAREDKLLQLPSGGPGRNSNPLYASIVISILTVNSKKKEAKCHFCVGCDAPRSNNAGARGLPHASKCKKLARSFPFLAGMVKDALHSTSLSQVLAGNAEPAPLRKKRKAAEVDSNDVPNIVPKVQASITTSFAPVKITSHQQAWIDYCLLRLVLCMLLPFSLLDSKIFMLFCQALCPSYNVPERSSFMSKHIAAESEVMSRLVREHIHGFSHNTLSFDGWSSAGHDEIYTVHITTPRRRHFLVAGLDLTTVSTSTDNLFSAMQPVIEDHDPRSISLCVSDSAKNVHNLRTRIREKWVWIIIVPDTPHILNLLAKDLVLGSKKFPKVQSFSVVATTVGKITNSVSHSNHKRAAIIQQLRTENREDGYRGLQSAGGTRFSTFATNTASLLRCWDALCKCTTSGAIKWEGKGTKEIKELFVNDENGDAFRRDMKAVLAILGPIARGLETLEGSHIMLSDVVMVLAGIAIAFKAVFNNPNTVLYRHREHSYAAFNRRVAFILEEGSDEAFLLAYLLDPVYVADGGLIPKLGLPARDKFKEMYNGGKLPSLLTRLVKGAMSMFKREQSRRETGGADDMRNMVHQLTAYLYRERPFDYTISDLGKRFTYWESMADDSRAGHLAVIGIKLFSILPTEMCDERTASRMGGMSTAKRNGLSSANIISATQLQQYWSTGVDKSQSEHHPQLQLSEETTREARARLQLPVPTLSDLLNPIPEHDEQESDNTDPYNLEALFDPEDEQVTPVIRGGTQLEIYDVINLNSDRLCKRYEGKPVVDATPTAPSGSSKEKQKVKWNPGEYNVDDFQL